MSSISKLIEAILFWKGEPVSEKKLAELCSASLEDTETALLELEMSLKDRGIVLMRKDGEVMLGTSEDASSIIEKLTREELSRELSKAALETLSIIIYMGPVRRSTIDHIRGVNSQFSVRHLEIRGLVEKMPDSKDSRVYLYRPTFNLLAHLGIKSIEELLNLEDVRDKLKSFENSNEADEPSS